MTDHQQILSVRTLGDFTIARGGKPVAVTWPDNATMMLFCSLLSPLDVTISLDRLCNAIWGIPESVEGKGRLAAVLGQLHDVMMRHCGVNPVVAEDDGITLDYGKAYVDARDFHETAITGFMHFASGNTGFALSRFRKASTLYRGVFLPGMAGRVISATRIDLEQQYQMLARQIQPLPQRPDIKTSRQSSTHYCATA